MQIIPQRRKTIRTKISLAFAGAVVLVAAVSGFGVVQLQSVNQATREIREIWLPRIELLNRLKGGIDEHRLLAIRRSQTTNFRHLATIGKQMEALRISIDNGISGYQPVNAREEEALREFGAALIHYRGALRTVDERLESGELGAAGELQSLALTSHDRANQHLSILSELAKRGSKVAEVRAQEAYQRAVQLMVGVTLLALLSALCASIWTARSVSNPIMRVSEAMRRLAAGDHTASVDEPAGCGDEISVLVASVNGYRESLIRGRQLTELAELDRTRLHAAISNMPIGLAMFDADSRLIICNPRYAAMYKLPKELTEPGTRVERILRERVSSGAFASANSEEFLASTIDMISVGEVTARLAEFQDGRHVSMIHQPLPGGGWVSTHEDVTERQQVEARIHHMARHDALTDLPNRTLLRERLDDALKQVARGDTVAVMCTDLDHFKTVNDTLGHPIGDALLRAVADRLRSNLREVDTVARFGGDEFAVVQTGLGQPDAASALAQRLISALSASYEIEGNQINIGCSVGVAIAPADGEVPDELIKKADTALYRAKLEGRGTFRFFEPGMDERVRARRALDLDLRRALNNGEFELHYQPVVNLKRSELKSFEALLRWNHPQRGLVMPGEFIPMAEETGLIKPIGEWVLHRACRDASDWPAYISVAVNLSAVQFKGGNLVTIVSDALAAADLSPNRLELEITESVLLKDSEGTLAIMRQLQLLGVRISMDDFGTGHSSLSYLRTFPFNKIKIDRSFISNVSHNEQALAIVQAITSLGTVLGMATTAEGVETLEQLERLRLQGCTEGQGYYFSPPRPACEVAKIISAIEEKLAA